MDVLAELVGESSVMESVRNNIRRLLARPHGARRLPSVLLQGETGTGKGLVARLLHQAGPRPGGPFVDVNCAAIPEPLLEAELFGFERGAFTDARRSKPGLFQTAHRGTIFLDEVGLLPDALQAKLLKVIEEQAVRRLGSTANEAIDTWIVSATNADLESAIRERSFREDLYHRLAVLTMRLPPLRERDRDVLLLARRFLSRACADYGLPEKTLAESADARLLSYPWPGNIRELFNVIERVALLAEGIVVTGEMLALPEITTAAPAPRSVAVSVDDAMREHLLATLEQTRWNISRASALLGISRNTVRARIERFGLRAGAREAAPRRHVEPVSQHAPPPAPSPSAPVAAPSAIRWEQRRITLLRAILIRSEEEALSDTSRALELIVDKVRSFGGRVEELSPRGITAAFGLEPVEDAPRRAAHAATAIQRAPERTRRGNGERFTVKIAIHVGDVLVGQSGTGAEIDADAKRAEWAVLDALLVGAEPGGIVVSAAAAPFLARRFDLAALRVAEPGAAYRLGGRERAGFGREGKSAWFWGRRQELDLLKARLGSARAGHGQIVGIVGEAGIGKSRLLYEFSRIVREQQWTYLEGHCLSYGSSIPYLPAIEILRHANRLAEADRPPAIARKLGASLQPLGINPQDALPYLLQFLGVKEGTESLAMVSPDAIRTRTFDILRRICVNASRLRPLVLAIEDVHWIDTATEALGQIVESLEGMPLLLVVTCRPGHRPPWLDKSHVTQIALQPLSAEDSMGVLSGILSGADLAEPVAQLIVEKAEGNPFFLEELARSVAAQGEARPTLGTPHTVQEVLLARINRLPESAKRFLQAAAVLGREVSRRLLTAMWGESGGFEETVRDLMRLEFLYERAGAEEPVYVFRHALTQEVAYSSLLERHRRAHHAAAGAALERLYAERTHEVAELLAHHFGRSDEAEKAVDYALLAAGKAHRRWANTEALAHFDASLKRLDTMLDTDANRLRRIDAVVQQAEVKFALGQHAEHIHALEGIRELVETTADPSRRATWYYWTGFLHSLTGSRPEVAMTYCREAADIARACGLAELRAYSESCLAQIYLVAGDLRGALEVGERALATFEPLGNVWWTCRTLSHLAPAANALGDWTRSRDYCRQLVEHGRAANDLRLKVVGWWRTASAHLHRGSPEEALRCCEEALALSPLPFDATMAKAMQGYALVKAGKAPEGISLLADAVAWLKRSHLHYTRSVITLWLADAHLAQGDHGRAAALSEEVLAASREVGYGHLEGMALRLLGEALEPDDPAAVGHLEMAARILEAVGARNEHAKALVSQARRRQAAGDRGGARRLLERALAIFEELGTLDEPPRVRATLAKL